MLLFFHRLDKQLELKISDFGLSKILNNEESFIIDSKTTQIPIKWMSIEAIQENKFSSKSDVVCTFGKHL